MSVVEKVRPSDKKPTVFRLSLECGHVAYVGRVDEHRRGFHRMCQACDASVVIEKVERFQ